MFSRSVFQQILSKVHLFLLLGEVGSPLTSEIGGGFRRLWPWWMSSSGCPGWVFRVAVWSVVPSASLGLVANGVSGMRCCAGGRQCCWSAEKEVHCSACPGSAGGTAPSCCPGQHTVRGSAGSIGRGLGAVGRRALLWSGTASWGSCMDMR